MTLDASREHGPEKHERPQRAPSGVDRSSATEANGAGQALLLVDVFNDFRHQDGATHFHSFRTSFHPLLALLSEARRSHIPVVYANDALGEICCSPSTIVDRARLGPAGARARALAPQDDELFVVKPFYSAFEQKALDNALRGMDVGHIFVAGTSTEHCVAQTVTSARERGYRCTVISNACATVDERRNNVALDFLRSVAAADVILPEELGARRPLAAGFSASPPGARVASEARGQFRAVSG